MQQEQRPEWTRKHRRAEFDAGRAERSDRHGQQHREHGLLSADDGARQMIEGPEGRDRANLRQHIDAEHVVARSAERDVGEPERQRRAEIGADLIFTAESEHDGEIAGRTAIEHERDKQPQRCLQQHHDPDHQPRPGTDQFDNQGSETHERSEILKANAKNRRWKNRRYWISNV